MEKYPVLKVDLNAIKENASVMTSFCKKRGISVAGVIKFSDGSTEIAKAYSDGGCSEIASSRTRHLKAIKSAFPYITTMLIRIPMFSECMDVVKWCDISLNSEELILRRLDECAAVYGKKHKVILMMDVGDRREGVVSSDELLRLAMLVETELTSLELAGVGSSFACASGVLPDWDNLTELAEAAEAIESAIGRKLDIVSGGSSITLTLLANGRPVPEKINHLRIGGAIANPMAIRRNRGVEIDGLREDAFTLTAEIAEVQTKPSAAAGSGKNWAGQIVEREDIGTRTRAIIALGSQDIGNADQLIPHMKGVGVLTGSSDHTIMDVTDSRRRWLPGDLMDFSLYYMGLLQCFATRNVTIRYIDK